MEPFEPRLELAKKIGRVELVESSEAVKLKKNKKNYLYVVTTSPNKTVNSTFIDSS